MNSDGNKLSNTFKENQSKVCRSTCRKEDEPISSKFTCKCENCSCYVCDDEKYEERRQQDNAPPVEEKALIKKGFDNYIHGIEPLTDEAHLLGSKPNKKICRGPCAKADIKDQTPANFDCKCPDCICYVCDDEKYADRRQQVKAPTVDEKTLVKKVSEKYVPGIEQPANEVHLPVSQPSKKICHGPCSKTYREAGTPTKFECKCPDCICYVCDDEKYDLRRQQDIAPPVDEKKYIKNGFDNYIPGIEPLTDEAHLLGSKPNKKVCRGPCAKADIKDQTPANFDCKCPDCICYVCDDDKYAGRRQQVEAPIVDEKTLVKKVSEKYVPGIERPANEVHIPVSQPSKKIFHGPCSKTYREAGSPTKFECKCPDCICYVCDDEKYVERRQQSEALPVDEKALIKKESEKYVPQIKSPGDEERLLVTQKNSRGHSEKSDHEDAIVFKFECKCKDCICYVCDDEKYEGRRQQGEAPTVDEKALVNEALNKDATYREPPAEELLLPATQTIKKICRGPCAKKNTKEELLIKFVCNCRDCICYVCDDEKYEGRRQQNKAPLVDKKATVEKEAEIEASGTESIGKDILLPVTQPIKKICYGPCAKSPNEMVTFMCTCKDCICYVCDDKKYDGRRQQSMAPVVDHVLLCKNTFVVENQEASVKKDKKICHGLCAITQTETGVESDDDTLDKQKESSVTTQEKTKKELCVCKKNYCGKCLRGDDFKLKSSQQKEECPILSVCTMEHQGPPKSNETRTEDLVYKNFICNCQDCICYVCDDEKYGKRLQQQKAPTAVFEIPMKKPCVCKKNLCGKCLRSATKPEETTLSPDLDILGKEKEQQIEQDIEKDVGGGKAMESIEQREDNSQKGSKHLNEPYIASFAKKYSTSGDTQQSQEGKNEEDKNAPCPTLPICFGKEFPPKHLNEPCIAPCSKKDSIFRELQQGQSKKEDDYKEDGGTVPIWLGKECPPEQLDEIRITPSVKKDDVLGEDQPKEIEGLLEKNDDEKSNETLPAKNTTQIQKKTCICKKNYCGKCPRGFTCKCKNCICYVCDDPKYEGKKQQIAPPPDLNLLSKNTKEPCPVMQICADESKTETKPEVASEDKPVAIPEIKSETKTPTESELLQKVCRGPCSKKGSEKFTCTCKDCLCYVCDDEKYEGRTEQQKAPPVNLKLLSGLTGTKEKYCRGPCAKK